MYDKKKETIEVGIDVTYRIIIGIANILRKPIQNFQGDETRTQLGRRISIWNYHQ